MRSEQNGGGAGLLKRVRALFSTPDPVISPDAPSRIDLGAPTKDQYPPCDGTIPLEVGGASEKDEAPPPWPA